MTDSLLDNELIRKYFGLQNCEHAQQNNACCSGCFAKAVLAAMQQPIRKGERYLQQIWEGHNSQEITWEERIYDGASGFGKFEEEHFHATWHSRSLRLHDAFQEQECDLTGWVTKCPNCGKTHGFKREPTPEKCLHCAKPAGECKCLENMRAMHRATCPDKPKDASFMCEDGMCECHIPGHTRHHLNQDAVEEKIKELVKYWPHTPVHVESILRDLVRLAREHK